MNIQIIADHFEIDAYTKELVNKKIGSELEKHLQDFAEDLKQASVRIKKLPRWGYKVNFDMRLPGKTHIFTEAVDKNLKNAIHKVRDEAKSQVTAYKGRLINRSKGSRKR